MLLKRSDAFAAQLTGQFRMPLTCLNIFHTLVTSRIHITTAKALRDQ